MGAEEKRLVVSGGVTGSLVIIGTGFKLAFPDMIVPFGWALALIVVGLLSLLITLVFAYRVSFPSYAYSTPGTGGSFHLLSRARYLEAVQASDEELEYWSNADEMRLWQAAYLWAGKIPASDYPKDAAGIVKAFAERMARDIKRGSLQSAGSTTEGDPLWLQLMGRLSDQTEYATVTRRALVEYARLRNEKPRFLNLGQ